MSVALVAGGTAGIGGAFARAFAARGDRVAILELEGPPARAAQPGPGQFGGGGVGAAAALGLQNHLAGSAIPIIMVVGTIFVACVRMFRRGVVGEIIHRLGRKA